MHMYPISFVYIYTNVWTLAWWLECSLMAQETWVHSQVESYKKLKKWYLMHPCLTLNIIRYWSRVKWSNPGKGVAPSSTPLCSSDRKGSLRVTLDYGSQLYFSYIDTLNDYRVLKSSEKFFITRVATSNSFVRVFNPTTRTYIYMCVCVCVCVCVRVRARV